MLSVFALTSHFFLDTHKKPTVYQHWPVHLSFSHHPSIFADTFSVLKNLKPSRQPIPEVGQFNKQRWPKSLGEKKHGKESSAVSFWSEEFKGCWHKGSLQIRLVYNHKHGTHLDTAEHAHTVNPRPKKRKKKKTVTLFRSISLIGVLYRADSCPFSFTAWTLPVAPPMFYSSELTFWISFAIQQPEWISSFTLEQNHNSRLTWARVFVWDSHSLIWSINQ